MQSSTWRSAHNLFYLAAAGLIVLLSLLGVELPERMQIWCLVLLVALVGIPHGALDPLVAYSSGLARTGPRCAASWASTYCRRLLW